MRYAIYQKTTGFPFGIYEGANEAEALAALAEDSNSAEPMNIADFTFELCEEPKIVLRRLANRLRIEGYAIEDETGRESDDARIWVSTGGVAFGIAVNKPRSIEAEADPARFCIIEPNEGDAVDGRALDEDDAYHAVRRHIAVELKARRHTRLDGQGFYLDGDGDRVVRVAKLVEEIGGDITEADVLKLLDVGFKPFPNIRPGEFNIQIFWGEDCTGEWAGRIPYSLLRGRSVEEIVALAPLLREVARHSSETSGKAGYRRGFKEGVNRARGCLLVRTQDAERDISQLRPLEAY